MGFNFFGGKKEGKGCRISDATYISEQAKCNAIVDYATQNSSDIFIAWFPESALLYKKLFIAKGLDDSRVLEAKHYSSLKYPGKQLAMVEHYPLPAKEDQFIQQLEQKNITVYNAISDPLFEKFGGGKIGELMKSMGIKEDEVISHDMINKSIRRAQEKLANSIPVDQSAASQEEWFKRNFPKKMG